MSQEETLPTFLPTFTDFEMNVLQFRKQFNELKNVPKSILEKKVDTND